LFKVFNELGAIAVLMTVIDGVCCVVPTSPLKGVIMRKLRGWTSAVCVMLTPLGYGYAIAADSYPTAAIAEYVLVCMKANGETRDALERCSCSIDVITSVIPYEHFVAAETFKRMGLLNGEKGEVFRGSAPAKAAITELNRAQIEAEVRCF
jgi:hypothetical protein